MGKFVPLPGYPVPVSNKIENRGDFFGTSNYQAGGELIVPATYGMTAIESVQFTNFAFSGNYYAQVIYPNNPNSTELQATAFQSASNNNNLNVQVKWLIAANNAQVANNTNLAAEGIRVHIVGV